MNVSTNQLILGGICAGGAAIAAVSAGSYFTKKKELDTQVEKAKIEGTYPPEYWAAKEAQAKADAEVKKAELEYKHQLEIDRRNRDDAEVALRREFEKSAPAEYWEQKRIEAEEKTKRELNKQRYEAERETAKQQRQAMDATVRMAEQALKRNTQLL